MDKSFKFILLLIGGIIVFAVMVCIFVGIIVFSVINKQKNADYYTLGNDRIASVKAVVGGRSVNSVSTETSNGVMTKVYEYKSGSSAADIEQYETYLQEQEGFMITSLNEDGKICYGKNSEDEGQIIIVDIADTRFGFILTIKKGEGSMDSK